MINTWSLLHDEIYGDESMITTATSKDYDEFWENDGFSMVGNPSTPSSDTIVFSGSHLKGGMGDDHITFTGDNTHAATFVPMNMFGESQYTINFNNDLYDDFECPHPPQENTSTPNSKRKYSEDEIIKELQEYIGRTYDQHYSAGDDKIQTLDLIEACGDGEAFCRSNILKYASRYDKKGTARRDIMKILHYAVLLMHFNDKNANRETYPQ